MKRLAIAVLVMSVTSCTAPSEITQVAGVWSMTTQVQTLTVQSPSGSGFACNSVTLLTNAGINRTTNSTLQISQQGSDLSATTTGASSGATTTYTGTASASTAYLSFKSCNLCEVRGAACGGGGAVVDLMPQSDSVTASVTGSTMSGTENTVYALTDTGTSAPLGTLQVGSLLSATKQ